MIYIYIYIYICIYYRERLPITPLNYDYQTALQTLLGIKLKKSILGIVAYLL